MNVYQENQTMIVDQVAQYYAVSASNHERIYDRPERAHDLARMRLHVADALAGHTVLELACGAGYWTRIAAEHAVSVTATDLTPEMIALARLRAMPGGKVRFALADAFNLPPDIGHYSAVFAAFWWSHVKREQYETFLGHLRERLGKDTVLVLVDDCYVEGSSPTVARTDLHGNTYHIAVAADGQRYEIITNYPSDSTLRKKMASSVREIRITRLEYYAMMRARLK